MQVLINSRYQTFGKALMHAFIKCRMSCSYEELSSIYYLCRIKYSISCRYELQHSNYKREVGRLSLVVTKNWITRAKNSWLCFHYQVKIGPGVKISLQVHSLHSHPTGVCGWWRWRPSVLCTSQHCITNCDIF